MKHPIRNLAISAPVLAALAACAPEPEQFRWTEPVKEPSAPVITLTSGATTAVYPYPHDTPGRICLSVSKADSGEEVTVTAESPDVTVELAAAEFPDRREVELSLRAKEDFADSALIRVTAANAAGVSGCEIRLARAYFNMDSDVIDLPSYGGGSVNLRVSANVPVDAVVEDDPDGMVEGTGEDGATGATVVFLKENTTVQGRSARIRVSDSAAGVLGDGVVVINQPGRSVPLVLDESTDRMAFRILDIAMQEDKKVVNDVFARLDKPLTDPCWKNFSSIMLHNRLCEYKATVGYGDYKDGYVPHECSVPPEIGWLDYLCYLGLSGELITGPLPENLKNCKKLQRIVIDGTHIEEKLEDSPIRYLPSLLLEFWPSPYQYGPVPQWLSQARDGSIIGYARLSGEIPEDVVPKFIHIESFILSTRNYFNYALWVGERPDNVRWVSDEHEGHWEWTDTIFDEETGKWKREGETYKYMLWGYGEW